MAFGVSYTPKESSAMRQVKATEQTADGLTEGRQNGARGHGAKTEAQRERAILALLAAPTIGVASKGVRNGRARTLRRWITEDAAFELELTAARRAVFDAGVQRVQALTAMAVETLADLLAEKKHPSVRLGAARAVLEIAVNRHYAETLLKRIEDLERWKPDMSRP